MDKVVIVLLIVIVIVCIVYWETAKWALLGLLALIFVGFCISIYKRIRENQHKQQEQKGAIVPNSPTPQVPTVVVPEIRFFKREKIMTLPETYLYKNLSTVCRGSYLVYPQVSLGTFITMEPNKWDKNLSKVVDFCITTNDYEPIAVIELNDKGHLKADRILRDEIVAEICEEAEIPLITFWTQEFVGKTYDEKIKLIKNAFESSLIYL